MARTSTWSLPAASFVRASSQSLTRGSNASLQTGNISFWIAGWVYVSTALTEQLIALKGDDLNTPSTYEYNVDIFGNGKIGFVVSDGVTPVGVTATTFGVLPLNTWLFFSAWKDISTNTIKISVNDGAVNSAAQTGGATTTNNFRLGYDISGGGSKFLNGRVQYLGFWKKVPTAAEITRLYNSGKPLTYAQVAADSMLPTSLISYWPLTEQSGSRADATATGNTLTQNNGVLAATGVPQDVSALRTVAGARTSTWALPAASFVAASSQYLSHASNASLQTGNISFTVAGWAYSSTVASEQQIVGKATNEDGDTTWEYYIRFENSKVQFAISDGSAANYLSATTFGNVPSATWVWFVAWYDSVAHTVNISINNGGVDSAAWSTGAQVASNIFSIGAQGNGFGRKLTGRVQYLGFWKKVLSAAEITRLYNAGKGLTYAQLAADATLPTSLISYWPLTEQSGSRADATATGNTLTQNNGVLSAAGNLQDVSALRAVAGARTAA